MAWVPAQLDAALRKWRRRGDPPTAVEGSTQLTHNEISGGVFFGAVVQGQRISVSLPRVIAPALSGLPPASAAFTGRSVELGELLQGLAPDSQHPVLVSALAGLGGIGKTELAVQTATHALREGWFPGGVLFVDLFGYDAERRLSPESALEGLLRALGVPVEHIPPDLQDRSRLYRSALAALAKAGSRVLVVIDNASGADQVRPLLPSDRSTAVLLTSRDTLDVGARLHDLAVLDEAASVDLLDGALREARGAGDTRVRDAPDDAAAVARLCAGLPLALRIAAALLADNPTRPVSSLATALAERHSRLSRLRRQDQAVRAAFDLSYQHLDDLHGRLLRLLTLNPGPDLSTEVAARLTGSDQHETEEMLQDLARSHLLEPGRVWGRWRLHDLLRLYADELGRTHARTDHRDDAQARLHDHYVTTTEAAVSHVGTPPDRGASRSADTENALAWLDGERANLVATATAAPPLGCSRTTISLAAALPRYLHHRRYFDDLITVTTAALTVLRDEGDRHGEGAMLIVLGDALREARRFAAAVNADAQAVVVHRELGDRSQEAKALCDLGRALPEVYRIEEAVDALTQGLAAFRDLADSRGEAIVQLNLGNVLLAAARVWAAGDSHSSALTIFREVGDRQHEAEALDGLADVLRKTGQLEEAIDTHVKAVDILREVSDRHQLAEALHHLGNALHQANRPGESLDAYHDALAIFQETDDHQRQAEVLCSLGDALRKAQRIDEASDACTRAAGLFRDLGDWQGEARALVGLGNLLRMSGRKEEGEEALHQGLSIQWRVDDRSDERIAEDPRRRELVEPVVLGNALGRPYQPEDTVTGLLQIVAHSRYLGDLHVGGIALDELGKALQQVGRFEEAVHAHARAVTVHIAMSSRPDVRISLQYLTEALAQVGTGGGVLDAYLYAADGYRYLDDREGEGLAWNGVGNSFYEQGRPRQAVNAYTEAATIFQDSGDQPREAAARYNLSSALMSTGSPEAAVDALTRALVLLRDSDDRGARADALTRLCLALWSLGRLEEAIDAQTRGLAVSRDLASRDREARALHNLGSVLQEAQQFEAAVQAYTEGLAVFRELGDSHGEAKVLDRLRNIPGGRADG